MSSVGLVRNAESEREVTLLALSGGRAGSLIGDLLQAFVAGLVPEGIVVGLEIINVQHDDGQGDRFSERASPFLVQKGVKLSTIGNTGQAVQAGETEEHLIRVLKLSHHLQQL